MGVEEMSKPESLLLERDTYSPRTESGSVFTLSAIGNYYTKQPYLVDLGFCTVAWAEEPHVQWFQNIVKTLKAFTQIPENWDGERAPQIRQGCICNAVSLLGALVEPDTPEPYVFPTPDGGIQFEWHTKKIDLEIEFVSQSKVIVLFTDAQEKTIEFEGRLPYSNRLQQCILQLSGD
jgi:hypothetical protein